jgi:hypothetical protein
VQNDQWDGSGAGGYQSLCRGQGGIGGAPPCHLHPLIPVGLSAFGTREGWTEVLTSLTHPQSEDGWGWGWGARLGLPHASCGPRAAALRLSTLAARQAAAGGANM